MHETLRLRLTGQIKGLDLDCLNLPNVLAWIVLICFIMERRREERRGEERVKERVKEVSLAWNTCRYQVRPGLTGLAVARAGCDGFTGLEVSLS